MCGVHQFQPQLVHEHFIIKYHLMGPTEQSIPFAVITYSSGNLKVRQNWLASVGQIFMNNLDVDMDIYTFIGKIHKGSNKKMRWKGK